jgi:hypothetical protein
VIRPSLPSSNSEICPRSSIECSAKKERGTRLRVASQATALAPFSQNSAACLRLLSGSGQAQDGQSKPRSWFILRNTLPVRSGPISRKPNLNDESTAGTPAAFFFGCSMSTMVQL